MLKINREVPPLDPALLESVKEIDFPTFGHFLEEGFVDTSIHRIVGSTRLIGRAITVRTTGQDSTLVHTASEMLSHGDVLVIDTGGDRRHAPVGGIVINSIAKSGAAGVVLDGVCTDRATLAKHDIPLYARGTSVLTTKLLGLEAGGINVPVSVGGVPVLPGYIVFGDDNGVFVGDPADVTGALAAARQSDLDEPPMLERLWAGERLTDMAGSAVLLERIFGAASRA